MIKMEYLDIKKLSSFDSMTSVYHSITSRYITHTCIYMDWGNDIIKIVELHMVQELIIMWKPDVYYA